jgi:pimeloyl-ACP methyl ester carboxylesterase
MPLVKVNATQDVPALDGGGDLDGALASALAACAPGAPVIVLVHGYKFSPARPGTSPHTHILSLAPSRGSWKARSWPRALGFGTGAPKEGLCIAFGWEARGSIWGAWRRAALAGQALADLLTRLAQEGAPPAGVIGHSLGARVALAALASVPPAAVGRIVLLAAAEFCANARVILATPAGRSAEIVNVTTRENAVFDRLLELFVAAPRPGARALGAGLPKAPRTWLDLPLDCNAVRGALDGMGFPIPAPDRRVCHWSPYLRHGVFPLYASLLRDPDRLPLDHLQHQIDRAARREATIARRPGRFGRPAALPEGLRQL